MARKSSMENAKNKICKGGLKSVAARLESHGDKAQFEAKPRKAKPQRELV